MPGKGKKRNRQRKRRRDRGEPKYGEKQTNKRGIAKLTRRFTRWRRS